ncbi:MAG: response regulator transcription factor [Candidatus Doudnabacteria bacterium]|nr:response regulator transcription factor [Candidatus Doudnabacteria bacterium]
MSVPKKILIAEDDPGISELIETVLEERGYAVEICPDGHVMQELLAGLRENGFIPDLILLDLWIPGIDGEKMARLLKNNTATRQIRIVIVSAQRNLQAIVDRTGADGFLAKPFDIDTLLAVVRQHTGEVV